MRKIFITIMTALFTGASFWSCQNFEEPEMIIISDDDPAFSGPLQRYWAFENSVTDSILGARGVATGVAYAPGIRGQAYRGSASSIVEYASAGKLATMESFTVSFWFNTEKHTGGAQCLFMLPNTEDFWGNLFFMIEGNDNANDNSMLPKFHFAGQWVEFNQTNNPNGLNRWPDAYGKWKHVAFTYDGNTSQFAAYLDGQALPLAETVRNRVAGGNPLGPLKFQNVSKFVIGGFQQHIGIQAPAADWMLRYTGLLDQFRVYTQALTPAEIQELFNSKS